MKNAFLFHFRSRGNQVYVLPSFSFFSPHEPQLNLLEKLTEDKPKSLWKLLTHKLFDILRSKEGIILRLGQLIKYYISKNFMERYTENLYEKLETFI